MEPSGFNCIMICLLIWKVRSRGEEAFFGGRGKGAGWVCHQITPPTQGGAEGSIRLLLTKHTARFFCCPLLGMRYFVLTVLAAREEAYVPALGTLKADWICMKSKLVLLLFIVSLVWWLLSTRLAQWLSDQLLCCVSRVRFPHGTNKYLCDTYLVVWVFFI